jgi:hypothetical protein
MAKVIVVTSGKGGVGNRTHAANILGISIRRLRKKLHGHAKNDAEITPASHGLGESYKVDAAH